MIAEYMRPRGADYVDRCAERLGAQELITCAPMNASLVHHLYNYLSAHGRITCTPVT